MTSDIDLHCLHGFLGQAKDFDFLKNSVGDQRSITANDRFSPTSLVVTTLAIEGQRIASQLARPTVLVGYSQGARLALHVALARPKNLEGLVLVSSHFGLEDKSDRATRLKQDEAWAKRFESDDWASVMRDWNDQPVLKGSTTQQQVESQFDRAKLAQSLRLQGLGAMQSLWAILPQIEVPTALVVGARDHKYVVLAQRAHALLPHSTVTVVEDSGHRVLVDGQKACAKVVAQMSAVY